MMQAVLLICIFSTIFITGLVWFVQIIHNPLMRHVGEKEFRQYEQRHTRLAGFLIAPVMLIELVATTVILINDPDTAIVIASGLLAVIWLSTFLIQRPLHQKLSLSFNQAHLGKLIRTNWIRTIAWTLKSAVMLTMIWDM